MNSIKHTAMVKLMRPVHPKTVTKVHCCVKPDRERPSAKDHRRPDQ